MDRNDGGPVLWPKYRDMTAEQMEQWGAEESEARKRDLSGVSSAQGLAEAQEYAKRRRGLIGASRGQATAMVIAANRSKRTAEWLAERAKERTP